MKTEKKVSIVIPAYKPMFFLQALKSAVGQTYENIEITVSDNCPNEDIRDICAGYPNVKYFRNNKVGYSNILSSLYGCTGDYIKPLFDDDILHPFCIERMVRDVGKVDFSFVFSASQVINIFNEAIGNRVPFDKSLNINYEQITRAMLLNFNNFVGELSTIMINRKALHLIEPERLSVFGDYDSRLGLVDVVIYLNLAEKFDVLYIPEILSYFRRDDRYNSNSRQDAIKNPNFKYAVTDWIDLIIQGHIKKIISDDEIKNANKLVSNLLGMYEANYPDVAKHNLIYHQYIDGVGAN